VSGYRRALDRLPSDAPLCASGKWPHRTEDEALVSMRRARAERAKGPSGKKAGNAPEARVYECPCCGWWHITAMTTKRRERRR